MRLSSAILVSLAVSVLSVLSFFVVWLSADA